MVRKEICAGVPAMSAVAASGTPVAAARGRGPAGVDRLVAASKFGNMFGKLKEAIFAVATTSCCAELSERLELGLSRREVADCVGGIIVRDPPATRLCTGSTG